MSHSNSVTSKDSGLPDNSSSNHSSGASSSGSTDTGKASSTSSLTHKLASLGLGGKGENKSEHKRTFSLPGRGGGGAKERREARESREPQISQGESQTLEKFNLILVSRSTRRWAWLGGLSQTVRYSSTRTR